MKLGIVGAGQIVQSLFEFIHEIKEIDLVAICATKNNTDRLYSTAKANNINCVYTDYDEFLSNTDIDVVYLGIPNSLHFSFAMKALRLNKHVIVEKPFCINYMQAKELAEYATKNKLILLEAISTIFNPNYLKIKELINAIGKVKIISLDYSQYSSRYDDFKKGIIKPAFDREKGGGSLMDLNVYNIHFVVGLFGKPNDLKYYANIEKNIDTSGILVMNYDSFQAVLIGAKDCGCATTNSIQAESGSICFKSSTNKLSDFDLCLNKKEVIHYDLTNDNHRMKYEFEEFLRIFQEKDFNKSNELLSHSLDVMEVLDKARVSSNIIFPEDS